MALPELSTFLGKSNCTNVKESWICTPKQSATLRSMHCNCRMPEKRRPNLTSGKKCGKKTTYWYVRCYRCRTSGRKSSLLTTLNPGWRIPKDAGHYCDWNDPAAPQEPRAILAKHTRLPIVIRTDLYSKQDRWKVQKTARTSYSPNCRIQYHFQTIPKLLPIECVLWIVNTITYVRKV